MSKAEDHLQLQFWADQLEKLIQIMKAEGVTPKIARFSEESELDPMIVLYKNGEHKSVDELSIEDLRN